MKSSINNQPANLIGYLSILCFSLSVWISFPLWVDFNSNIIRAPRFEILQFFNTFGWGLPLFFLTYLGIIYGICSPHKKRMLYGLLGMVILFLADINRLNSWSYFYLILWLLFYLSESSQTSFLLPFVMFVSLVYIWSGIHKINPHYYYNEFQWQMGILSITKPLEHSHLFSKIIPLAEIIFGILLWFRRTRIWGVYLLIGMHLYIILSLLTAKWNYVVIPWNLCMIICLILIRKESFDLQKVWTIIPKMLKITLCTVGILLPALFCIDQINYGFAFTMYSGRNVYGNILLTPSDARKIDDKLKSKLIPYDGDYRIDIKEYGYQHYHAPPNYSEYAYKKLFYGLSKNLSDSSVLIITRCPLFRDSMEYEYVYKE